ncbi:MAG: hypothetical protein LBK06_02050 [Planctomycetaceae bacterium]|nr:hypothetical protein [Planctomycetaceae bacterium]
MAKPTALPATASLLLLYTEAGKAIGFALEQPLHVVALPCSAWRILNGFSIIFVLR